jgi:hypothetical protein
LLLLVVGRLAGRDHLFDVLQRQGDLVRTKTELHPLQLTQKMEQAVVPRQRRIPLRDGGRPAR